LPDTAENAALKLTCIETGEATIVKMSNKARQCQGLHMHDSLSQTDVDSTWCLFKKRLRWTQNVGDIVLFWMFESQK
jgi:hypothetical protein